MPRPSYEASVLLIGLDDTTDKIVGSLRLMGLAGIATAVLSQEPMEGLQTRNRSATFDVSTGETGRAPPAPVDVPKLADMARHYDIVVFVSTGTVAPGQEISEQLVQALEGEGPLVGGLVVRSGTDYSPELMAVLRTSVHMLVNVRSLSLAFAFIDALRGGAYR